MNGHRRSSLHTVKMAFWLVMVMALLMVLSACSSGGGSQTTYRLDVFLNDEDAGSVHRDPDKDRYLPNEIVTLTAVPEDDWDFSHWESDLTGNENPISITMDANKSVLAVFSSLIATEFAVQFVVIGSHGSLAVEADGQPIVSGDMVAQGAEVTFTATPDAGYQVKEWVVNGNVVQSKETTYTLASLEANLNVEVEFEAVPGEFAGGSGAEGDPYLIATPAQLDNVRNHLDKHFRVIAHLDLSGHTNDGGWRPIGESRDLFYGITYNPFTGVFDGDGYTISNLYMDRLPMGNGLFGATQGAAITKVVLHQVDVTGGNRTGALIGETDGCEISGCSVMGASQIEGVSDVGGLVGLLIFSNVSDSHVAGHVKGTNRIGGLVGTNELGTIEDSSSSATIAGADSAWRIGGFVGFNDNGVIRDSFAEGAVQLQGVSGPEVIGGFVGSSSGGAAWIERCFATGSIQGMANSHEVGGFVGSMFGGVIQESYAQGSVNAGSRVGGFVGYVSGNETQGWGLIKNCYALGDVIAQNQYGASFVAYQNRGDIMNCYSVGSAPYGTYQGGFYVYSSSAANITGSHFDRNTGGDYPDPWQPAQSRTTLQMQFGTPGLYIKLDGTPDNEEEARNLMYPDWDMTIWDFGTTSEYPRLRWQQ